MSLHLYLSLIPEALIASMLPPEDFGVYYTVGYSKKTAGQAMFVELDPEFRNDFFRIDEGFARCVPHVDGSPKKSVYIATYRVLEHIPLEEIKKLHLVTRYGVNLTLACNGETAKPQASRYLYQELAPTAPLVVSTYDPARFARFLTKDSAGILLPAVCFVDLQLGDLARDPEHGSRDNLPYDFIPQLRECLKALQGKSIHTMMVDRIHNVEYPYRMIQSGIYFGNHGEMVHFAMPPHDELAARHVDWWLSANK